VCNMEKKQLSKKTILILAANPKNSNSLRLDEEVSEIDKCLQRAKRRDEFILKQQLATSSKDIRRAMLDNKPNIVHFSGHGKGEDGLVFEDNTGQAHLVRAKALAGLFELFADEVECVLLNACYSKVQAQAIVQHIDSVIGMDKPIQDKTAVEFAVGFYDALGAGKSIEFAYKSGCNAIQLAGFEKEHLIPVLIQKKEPEEKKPVKNTTPQSKLSFQEKRQLTENLPSKIYDIFLSYAKADIRWCQKLAKRLQQANVKVWFDEWAVQAGDDHETKIEEGLKCARRIAAIWTPHYFHTDNFDNYSIVDETLNQPPTVLAQDRPLIPLLLHTFDIPDKFKKLKPIDFRNNDDFELRVRQLLEALDLPRQEFIAKAEDRFREYPMESRDKPNTKPFVEAAAALYRLLGYSVKTPKNAPFDLQIEQKRGGVPSQAVVFCVETYCTIQHSAPIVQYFNKSKKLGTYQWVVLAAQGFSEESYDQLNTHLNCATYAELLSELVPLEPYVQRLIANYEKQIAEHWNGKDWFIRPDVREDITEKLQPALDYIANWFGKSGQNLLTILGDLGCGKTTLAEFLAYNLARAFLDDPLRHPAPVLIPLKEVRKAETLESIIISHFSRSGLPAIQFPNFEHLLRLGKVVLLFDAFDEMADRVRWETTIHNFRELKRAAEFQSKIILTCRTHYFKDRNEQAKVIGQGPTLSEIETELYKEQRQYTNTQVVYLQEFDDDKICAYLRQFRPDTVNDDWAKIESIYNLKDLAHRPLLLDMIVKSLPRLEQQHSINAANLYSVYTNIWIQRQEQRERFLDEDSKLKLILELAWQMWDQAKNTIHYQELQPFIEQLVAEKGMDFNDEECKDIAAEIQTASFLKRDDDQGYFSFMHRSFMEYFLASKLLLELDNLNYQVLNTRRFDRKVVYFLTLLENAQEKQTGQGAISSLATILTEQYQTNISENALQILYWSRRINAGMEEKITDMAQLQKALQFPAKVQLQNAELAEITLEAAMLPAAQLRGANLFKANLNNSDFHGSYFQQADLTEARWLKANFQDCDLTKAILPKNSKRPIKIDSYPKRERLIAIVQRGHSWGVNAIAYSPNGKCFATASGDDVIRIWHRTDYRLLYTLEGHQRGVLSVAFDPSGAVLASGSSDKTVRLWDVNTAGLKSTLQGHQGWVRSVAFDPSGAVLASGSDDKNVHLWDVNTAGLKSTLQGHQSSVRSVAFDPSGALLASGSDDKNVHLWDVNTAGLKSILQGHQSSVRSVAFDPSGAVLASGSRDSTVRLWDVNTAGLKSTLQGHQSSVWSVAFDLSGALLASGSDDKSVHLWDVNTASLKSTLEGHQSSVRSVAFDPSEALLASGSFDNTVRLWDVNTASLKSTLEGHQYLVSSVAFDCSGTQLASGSDDKSVRLWDVSTASLTSTLEGHQSSVLSVAFDPSGALLASGSRNSTVRLWDVNTKSLKSTLEGHQSSVLSVAFDPSGALLASGSRDSTVRLWNVNTVSLKSTLEGHQSSVLSVTFDPSGAVLASGSRDSTVRLWDVNTKSLKSTLEGHQSEVWSVAFEPNGALLASGSLDSTVRLWDVNTASLKSTLEGHQSSVRSVAFDPSGAVLASGSWDSTVRLWDIKTGECFAVLTSHLGEVYSLAFAPNGGYLVAAGSAGRLQFLDIETYETFLYRYHFGPEAWLDLLPDGRFNASPEGIRHLCYTEKGTFNSYTAEELVKLFYDPEGVQEVLDRYV